MIIPMIAQILIALIAILHIYIMVLEIFLWESPRARAAFGTSPDFARATRVMAGNQGLYNGFLAAGLIWALFAGPSVAVFFLSCVLVAGIYGGLTASRRIFFIQALPAVFALVAQALG